MGSRFLLFIVAVVAMKQTVEAQPTAPLTASAEIQQDIQFLESGVDRLGGKSTSELHAAFISTKPEAIKLGQANNCPISITCNITDKFRSADGSCNNIQHPDWGQSFIPMRRFLPPQYGDGISSPRTTGSDGSPLVSARLVSTTLHTPDVDASSQSDVTHMVMQWGQFLDHDITNTPIERGTDGAAITCCKEDVQGGAPSPALNLSESLLRVGDGTSLIILQSGVFVPDHTQPRHRLVVPAEQLNQLTAYIDASQVYGSTEEEQHELRANTGGLLRTSSDNPELLPRNSIPDCVTSTEPNFCFKAGDERVDEHMSLTSMHTIWLREHNRVARKLASINPHWDDERLFQEARRIVGAMMQHITYAEFLPLVLSPTFYKKYKLRPSSGPVNIYDARVDASVHNAFATAAYRFGHSMLRSFFSRPNRRYKGGKDLQLRDSFGNTSIIISSSGDAINRLTRGLVVDRANSVDRHVSPEVSDFLFPDDEGNSLDLVSLNIQRGRDHGLPGYNDWRRWCGFPEAKDFKTSRGGLYEHSVKAAAAFQSLYRSPSDIDLFSGGISECPVPGGLVGNTFSCIIGRQFELLKIGDRFWYETDDKDVGFTPDQLTELRHTSLSRVVCDNTNTKKIQPNAFKRAGRGNTLRWCRQLPKVNLRAWREVQQGVWSAWSPWSACKRGWRTRRRSCTKRGRKCTGSKKQKEACGSDCGFQQWGAWGSCVQGCRYRRRVCDCRSCGRGEDFGTDNCKIKGKRGRKRICAKLYGYVKRGTSIHTCPNKSLFDFHSCVAESGSGSGSGSGSESP
ncbi:peroxidasin homolog [Haliotis rubra]|uniref:peroxidasin homolog n=1 Tax=Haliotis rubra TaxID=36100 RepID=UPI001EE5E0D1|nr:peroxidasin homolog [Haliotis rubra]